MSTRKDQVRRALAKSPQLFQQGLPFRSGQLIRVPFSMRLRPAVAAGKVAGPGGLPVNENRRLRIDQTAWPTSAYPMPSMIRFDHICHLASPFLVPTAGPADDTVNLFCVIALLDHLGAIRRLALADVSAINEDILIPGWQRRKQTLLTRFLIHGIAYYY